MYVIQGKMGFKIGIANLKKKTLVFFNKTVLKTCIYDVPEHLEKLHIQFKSGYLIYIRVTPNFLHKLHILHNQIFI